MSAAPVSRFLRRSSGVFIVFLRLYLPRFVCFRKQFSELKVNLLERPREQTPVKSWKLCMGIRQPEGTPMKPVSSRLRSCCRIRRKSSFSGFSAYCSHCGVCVCPCKCHSIEGAGGGGNGMACQGRLRKACGLWQNVVLHEFVHCPHVFTLYSQCTCWS